MRSFTVEENCTEFQPKEQITIEKFGNYPKIDRKKRQKIQWIAQTKTMDKLTQICL